MYEEKKAQGLMVITVAEDTAGNAVAAPWIDRAKPSHPSLVDDRHLVSELYDMVNVPTAVWIDEDGNIVRPPEPAGSEDSFRAMDRTTFALPDESRRSIVETQQAYVAAVRDWTERGDASPFALSADEVRARLRPGGQDEARAAAEFQMGEYLDSNGLRHAAERHFAIARQLRPESWNYLRQSYALEDPAKAGGPEYWAAVDALGDRSYYPAIRLEPNA